jgi:hypothetical protein
MNFTFKREAIIMAAVISVPLDAVEKLSRKHQLCSEQV